MEGEKKRDNYEEIEGIFLPLLLVATVGLHRCLDFGPTQLESDQMASEDALPMNVQS